MFNLILAGPKAPKIGRADKVWEQISHDLWDISPHGSMALGNMEEQTDRSTEPRTYTAHEIFDQG